jgi:hypothetical protein
LFARDYPWQQDIHQQWSMIGITMGLDRGSHGHERYGNDKLDRGVWNEVIMVHVLVMCMNIGSVLNRL